MGTGESGEWTFWLHRALGWVTVQSIRDMGACTGGLSLVSMSPMELGYDPVRVRGHLCGLCHVQVSGVWSSHKESE